MIFFWELFKQIADFLVNSWIVGLWN
jgi:hypothetical protein